MSPLILITTGIVMCLIGQLMKSWVRARQFSRVNAHGVQMFRTYMHMRTAQVSESTMSVVGFLLLLAGLLLCGLGLLSFADIPLPKVLK